MSNSILPESHLFLTAEHDMRSICSSLLNPLGITYFNYLCVYNDGSSYLLCTHSDLIKYVFDENIPVAAPIEDKLVKKSFNYFILPIGRYDELVHHAKINLKLAHFIDLVDRYDNYIELFCFGSTPENSGIVNFYLNNMHFLENFKLYFKEKAKNLLIDGEKNKMVLPDIMKPPYQGLINENKKSVPKIKIGEIELTPRQYDCLSQLAAGCTAKEAAQNLGLSYRTIENYLANLKVVLNCRKKSQLVHFFLNHSIYQ